MTGPFDRIVRCLDLGEAEIAGAAPSRDASRALLARLAEVSAPDTGTAKILLLMARMATTACEWLEGDLRVELTASGEVTELDTTTDIGGGMLERVLPRATLRAPLGEFGRAIDRVPKLIAPLTVRTKTASRILLTATSTVRRSTAPPPAFEIAQEALFVRAPAPPQFAEPPASKGAGSMGLPVVARPESAPPRSSTDPPLGDVDEGWGD